MPLNHYIISQRPPATLKKGIKENSIFPGRCPVIWHSLPFHLLLNASLNVGLIFIPFLSIIQPFKDFNRKKRKVLQFLKLPLDKPQLKLQCVSFRYNRKENHTSICPFETSIKLTDHFIYPDGDWCLLKTNKTYYISVQLNANIIKPFITMPSTKSHPIPFLKPTACIHRL